MVSQTLKFSDDLEHLGRTVLILFVQVLCRCELHQICTDMVLISVDLILITNDIFEVVVIVSVPEHSDCTVKTLSCLPDHLVDGVGRLGYGNGRCEHETLVEEEFLIFVAVLNNDTGQLNELLMEREEKDRIDVIEDRVECGDTYDADRIVHESEVEYRMERIEDNEP